jgi:gallate decarboxylase subunit D
VRKADTFVSGALPYKLSAEVKFIGADLLVIISGGEVPHIGSVAVALPRPSLHNRRIMSATASVYNLPGHKDQVIAQRVSEVLSSKLNCAVVVTAGFHRDGISRAGIKRVLENAEKLAEKISTALTKVKRT